MDSNDALQLVQQVVSRKVPENTIRCIRLKLLRYQSQSCMDLSTLTLTEPNRSYYDSNTIEKMNETISVPDFSKFYESRTKDVSYAEIEVPNIEITKPSFERSSEQRASFRKPDRKKSKIASLLKLGHRQRSQTDPKSLSISRKELRQKLNFKTVAYINSPASTRKMK